MTIRLLVLVARLGICATFALQATATSAQLLVTPLEAINPLPVIESVAPSLVTNQWADLWVHVHGASFVNGSRVRINGVDRFTEFVSQNELRVRVPIFVRSSVGTREVSVFNPAPGGGPSAAHATLSVVNAEPSITSIDPALVEASLEDLWVQVHGQDFMPDAEVRVNGESRITEFISRTELRARVNAADRYRGGVVWLTVSNPPPGGGLSVYGAMLRVQNPVPVLTSVSPPEWPAQQPGSVPDGPPVMVLSGAGFVEGAVVSFGGRLLTPMSVRWPRIEVPIPADELAVARTVLVSVINPAPGGGTSVGTRTFEIFEAPAPNPVPSVVEFQSEQLAVPEGSIRNPERGRLRVTRTGDLALAIAVPYAVAGTAVPGQDFTPPPGSALFTEGDTLVSLILSIRPNDTPESDRTVIVELQEGSSYQLGSKRRFELTIVDDDPLARNVELTGPQPLREGVPGAQAAAELNIQWTEPPAGVTPPASVTVHYTVEGTATPGVDYVALPGTLTVPFGQTVTPVAVTVLSDLENDPDESIILRLTPRPDYTLPRFRGGNFYLSIQDAAPVVTPAPRLLSISPDQVVASAANVSIQLLGENFMVPNGPEGSTVLWDGAPRAASYVSPTELTLMVTPQDMLFPGPRTIAVRNPAADATAVTSEGRMFMIQPAPLAIFSIQPSSAVEGATGLELVVAGQGFRAGVAGRPGTTLHWNGSQRITTVSTPNELRATISSAYLATAGTASVTLVNSEGRPAATSEPRSFTIAAAPTTRDPLPIVSFRVTQAEIKEWEAPREHAFNVIRRTPNGEFATRGAIRIPFTVSGNATQGVDYIALSARSPLEIAEGNSAATMVVHLLQDQHQEATESLIIRLEDGEGYVVDPDTRQLRLDIVDDDDPANPPPDEPMPVVSFEPVAGEVREAEAPRAITLRVRRRVDGQFATGRQIAIPVTVSGTAAQGSDYTVEFVTYDGRIVSQGPVVLNFGNSQSEARLTILQDDLPEDTESIIIRLEDGPGYTLDATTRQVQVDIIDDDPTPSPVPSNDPLPIVSFDVTETELEMREASRTVDFRVVRRTPEGQPATQGRIRVPFTVTGTATLDADYRISNSGFFLDYPIGNQLARIFLLLLQDDELEPTENIVIRLAEGEGYELDPDRRELRINIIEDDAPAVSGPPVLSRVTPQAAVRGDGPQDIELEGSSFVAGSAVRWAAADLETVLLNGRLRATLPESMLETTGTTLITVANPDGQLSGPLPFEVINPEPRLTSVQPASAVAGSSELEVTLRGQRFLQNRGHGQPGSSVRWNGEERSVTFVRPTELRVRIDAADLAAAGSATIAVVNPAPGGGTSAPVAFMIEPAPVASPVPTLTALEPDSARRGGAITLTVRGTDFVQGARVLWGATPVETSFISAGELQARVPAQLVAATRDESVSVTVENPAPGGGASATRSFRLLRPGG